MKYKVYYQKEGKLESKSFDAKNIKDLKAIKNYPVNVIHIKEKSSLKDLNKQIIFFKDYKKLLLNSFKQIKNMLDANLTFNSAIKLLLENKQDKFIYDVFSDIQISISNSSDIEKVLKKYEPNIDKTIILFLKLGLEKGNIKESVDSLVDILQQDINSTKKLKESLRYPFVLIISVIISLVIIFSYVIPNFEFIFRSLNGELPLSTKILIEFQNIIKNYWGYVFSFLLSMHIIFFIVYKRSILFFHKIFLLKIPFFSRVLQSYLYYKLFLSIYIIVRTKYQFQIAIEHSKDIIQNIYLKKSIIKIIQRVKKGKSIAKAFEDSKLFDNITIQLLYTAQHTNRYEEVLEDITIMYKQRFQEDVKNFISIINPLIILFVSFIILWIILAVMTPTWSLSSSL